MSKQAAAAGGAGVSDVNVMSRNNAPFAPTLPRDHSADSAPHNDSSQSSKQVSQTPRTTQTSQTSNPSSIGTSPVPSRDASPARPLARTNTSRASSTNSNTRSRKNSRVDTSPAASSRPNIPTQSSSSLAQRTLNTSTTPSLLPTASDTTGKNGAPQKSPTENLRDAPRWPVSPRLRSPPPVLNRPSPAGARKPDQEAPAISVQRSTPSPNPPSADLTSDSEIDDSHLQPGVRTPARGASSTSILETVQEASPLASPDPQLDGPLSRSDDRSLSELSNKSDNTNASTVKPSPKPEATPPGSDAASETGSVKLDRRTGAASMPPPLTSRQSSVSTKGVKGKPGEASLQSMTVETETVASIPQVALAANVGKEGPNGSLRRKPSSDTIKPKKEKKKVTRKAPSVTSGTGEQPFKQNFSFRPRLRHHHSIRSVASDDYISPPGTSVDDGASPWRHKSLSSLYHYRTSILTRSRTPASSKADIFEQKVASAVEEADSSDSDETFVYDSNPPDHVDRTRRFHSRTPSATSMASQMDKNGMRSLNAVMEGSGPSVVAQKKGMKFVSNLPNGNGNGNDNLAGDDDGKGTGRSAAAGSNRGTARHHHHFGRWGRNAGGGNGHPAINTEDFFHSTGTRGAKQGGTPSRQSSAPPSPHNPNATNRGILNGKRGMLPAGYDLDDTTGADDEQTPLLLPGTGRTARSGRNRRPYGTARALEQQDERRSRGVLARFACCLVISLMLLLVVSGAIGFIFATSQPLLDVKLVSMKNVLASEQELMLDLTVKAHNPNVVAIIVDMADIEVFAKSPHAGTDSEWWKKSKPDTITARDDSLLDPPLDPPPVDDTAPNMRLGQINELYSPLSFDGSFFNGGHSSSTGQLRLRKPGNDTEHGSERWERILDDEFDLILMGVLKYSLPLTQHVRKVSVTGRTTVKPNSANDPTAPNGTVSAVEISH